MGKKKQKKFTYKPCFTKLRELHILAWNKKLVALKVVALVFTVSLVSFIAVKKIYAVDPSLTISPSGYTNVDRFTFLLLDGPISNAVKYQYRTDGDTPGVWFDYNPPLSDEITIGSENPAHPQGAYTEGANQFYFQALDGSDNVLESLSAAYYYNTSFPSQIQNLNVAPNTNTLNSFTFSWDPPAIFFGDVNKIKYHYSVNAPPTQFNTAQTYAESIGPSAFATQLSSNTFYVVTQDEAGNIDYNDYAQIPFTANTTAPGIPTGVTIDDISDKDSGEYRLAISWTPPAITVDGNFNGCDIYKSTSALGPFTKLANTPETAYVDTGLTANSTHYYYVKATDKTQNESAQSSTVSATADGHYTVPPNITKNPEVSAKSKTATINWGTSREANSFVEYGKTSFLGQSNGNGASNYATNHTVTLSGLDTNATYFYRVAFTDPDGNTGYSSVSTFTTNASSTISNFKINSVSTTSATVSFTTNMSSKGEIEYGTTPSLGSRASEGNDVLTNHSILLSGLKSATNYFLRAKQTDNEGTIFYSDIYELTTLPQPTISNLGVEGKTNVNSPTVVINYQTNVETTTVIRYKEKDQDAKEYVSLDFEKEHIVELANLTALVEYELVITGEDKLGNSLTSVTETITTLSDTLPPKVTSLVEKIKVIGEGSNATAELTLKFTTSESSKARVEAVQGIESEKFDIISNEDSYATEHTITLKLGKPGIPYTYRLKLRDASANDEFTKPQSIVTPPANEGVLDFVSGVFSKTFGWLSRFIKL